MKNKTTFNIILGKKKKNVETEKQVGNQLEQRVERADTVFLQGIHTNRAKAKKTVILYHNRMQRNRSIRESIGELSLIYLATVPYAQRGSDKTSL